MQRHDRRNIYDLFYAKPAPPVRRKDCFEVDRAAARRRLRRDAARRGEGPGRAAPGAEGRRLSRRRDLPAQRLCQSRAREAARRADRRGAARRAGDLQPSGGARVPRVRARLDDTAVGLCAAGDRRLPASLREQAGRRRLHGPLHGDAEPTAAACPPRRCATSAITALYSGPAAGVVGATRRAARSGFKDLITFDMGGTSTDVCLVQDGRPSLASESEIDGLPIRTPVLDIVSVGAGGGSIAWVDDGGMLRVGPQSAGADPGPACYGKGGTEPATTDAHIVIGTIRPARLPGRPHDARRARPRSSAFEPLAERFGLSSSRPRRPRCSSPTPTSCAPSSSSRPSAAAIRATMRWCRSAARARCMPRASPRSSASRPSSCRPMPA